MSRKHLALVVVLGLSGCSVHDPREPALRQGMQVVRTLLEDARLKPLAASQKGETSAQRSVQALFSEQARPLWPPRAPEETTYSPGNQTLPGRIAYLREADLPWSVVVRADANGHTVDLQGYGVDVDKPLLQDQVEIK